MTCLEMLVMIISTMVQKTFLRWSFVEGATSTACIDPRIIKAVTECERRRSVGRGSVTPPYRTSGRCIPSSPVVPSARRRRRAPLPRVCVGQASQPLLPPRLCPRHLVEREEVEALQVVPGMPEGGGEAFHETVRLVAVG